MSLDTATDERSYLFGRLLAYADQAESLVLFKDKQNRLTNALRMKHQFRLTPRTVWGYLDNRLTYYYRKLGDNGSWFRYEISQVMTKFRPGDFSDERLDDTYLLGYYCQLAVLRSKKEEKPAGELDNFDH